MRLTALAFCTALLVAPFAGDAITLGELATSGGSLVSGDGQLVFSNFSVVHNCSGSSGFCLPNGVIRSTQNGFEIVDLSLFSGGGGVFSTLNYTVTQTHGAFISGAAIELQGHNDGIPPGPGIPTDESSGIALVYWSDSIGGLQTVSIDPPTPTESDCTFNLVEPAPGGAAFTPTFCQTFATSGSGGLALPNPTLSMDVTMTFLTGGIEASLGGLDEDGNFVGCFQCAVGGINGASVSFVSEPGVAVDIKPGSDSNSINLWSHGVVPVAILGSDTFDVEDVDVTTLAFGPAGAESVFDLTHWLVSLLSTYDANDDGFVDLVPLFRTSDTGIAFGDTEACITGELLDGTPFEGCDSIQTVPPACGIGPELAVLLPVLMWAHRRRMRLIP